MKNKTILLLAILILGINNVFSQNTDNNPIDIKLKACLDSTQNQTTFGMITCLATAEKSWDAELNKYYKLLQGILSPEEKAKLKASQIKWLAFRDAEFDTANLIYTDMQGTMWRVTAVNTQMELVKQRALELKAYYANLTIGK